MLTSLHVAHVGRGGPAFRAPKPAAVPGLVSADGGMTSVLGPQFLPRLQPSRVAMIGFWEDEASLDEFLVSHKAGQRLADGWQARLEPLRAFGSWPGLASDLRHGRSVETAEPVVVTTLARLKWSQARRFFKTSAEAEGQVNSAAGLIWASGFGSPPFLGTISLWESAQSAVDYAYGSADSPHAVAIQRDRDKTFHREKAFIRYRVRSSSGAVEGKKNPLPEGALA